MSEKNWLPKVDSRGHHWSEEIKLNENQSVSKKNQPKKPDKIGRKQAAKKAVQDLVAELFAQKVTVRTMEFEAVGVPRHYLSKMCDEGLLERIGFGLYRAVTSGGKD